MLISSVYFYEPSASSVLVARPVCVRSVLSLFLALVSVFSLTSHFLSSAAGDCIFIIFFLVSGYFFLKLFPCPTDHEPDWQPRVMFFWSVDMIGARSVLM